MNATWTLKIHFKFLKWNEHITIPHYTPLKFNWKTTFILGPGNFSRESSLLNFRWVLLVLKVAQKIHGALVFLYFWIDLFLIELHGWEKNMWLICMCKDIYIYKNIYIYIYVCVYIVLYCQSISLHNVEYLKTSTENYINIYMHLSKKTSINKDIYLYAHIPRCHLWPIWNHWIGTYAPRVKEVKKIL